MPRRVLYSQGKDIDVTVRDLEIARSLSNDSLHLILLPTEACNFRCTYCYEDFKYARMEPQVVEGVKNLLSRRAPGLVSLTLSWFGGEPLLARDIMEDILEHARTLASEFPAIACTSDVTTNAYALRRPLFERLLDLGVTQYQISFDGPQSSHDRKRVLANGRGTFERVWSNVLAMRDVRRDFTVIVRLHVDAENAPLLPEFIDQCGRELAGDARFKLFLRPLSRFGGPNDATLPVFAEEEIEPALAVLARCADAAGLQRHVPHEVTPVCYAARANSFLVRADGRLNKCTLALDHPANQVGRLHPDGSLDIDAPAIRPWMRGLASRDARQLECPMVGLAEPEPVGALSLRAG
jgi:uncharacterized protein